MAPLREIVEAEEKRLREQAKRQGDSATGDGSLLNHLADRLASILAESDGEGERWADSWLLDIDTTKLRGLIAAIESHPTGGGTTTTDLLPALKAEDERRSKAGGLGRGRPLPKHKGEQQGARDGLSEGAAPSPATEGTSVPSGARTEGQDHVPETAPRGPLAESVQKGEQPRSLREAAKGALYYVEHAADPKLADVHEVEWERIRDELRAALANPAPDKEADR